MTPSVVYSNSCNSMHNNVILLPVRFVFIHKKLNTTNQHENVCILKIRSIQCHSVVFCCLKWKQKNVIVIYVIGIFL